MSEQLEATDRKGVCTYQQALLPGHPPRAQEKELEQNRNSRAPAGAHARKWSSVLLGDKHQTPPTPLDASLTGRKALSHYGGAGNAKLSEPQKRPILPVCSTLTSSSTSPK